jgi:hypothetical protein
MRRVYPIFTEDECLGLFTVFFHHWYRQLLGSNYYQNLFTDSLLYEPTHHASSPIISSPTIPNGSNLLRLDRKRLVLVLQSPRTHSTCTAHTPHVISHLEASLRLIFPGVLVTLVNEIHDMRELESKVLGGVCSF